MNEYLSYFRVNQAFNEKAKCNSQLLSYVRYQFDPLDMGPYHIQK